VLSELSSKETAMGNSTAYNLIFPSLVYDSIIIIIIYAGRRRVCRPKFTLQHAMKAQTGSRGIALLFL
jgi:hypothetical protein